MSIFLFGLSTIWIIVGILVVRGAWNENESDYEQVNGKVSRPLELSYDQQHDGFYKPRVVTAKIYLEDDTKEYTLGGNTYHLNKTGMESIEVGETLRLFVKKTTVVGGFKTDDSVKSVTVSGLHRSNGEVIIALEKGMKNSRKRLLTGFGLIGLGLFIGIWTFLNK